MEVVFLGSRLADVSTRQSCLNSHRSGVVTLQKSISNSRRIRAATKDVAEKDSVEESVLVLKAAAKSKKVPAPEVYSAIRVLEKARLDPSNFLEILGGTGTPRSWMLVFIAGAKVVGEALEGGPGGGTYFPFTAVQQYDATARSIRNGLYLGALGTLEFMGRFSWSENKLFFIFDSVSIKLGPLGPFKFAISKKEEIDREPGDKDQFFMWFYADDEIVVGRGRGGGVALRVRCSRKV